MYKMANSDWGSQAFNKNYMYIAGKSPFFANSVKHYNLPLFKLYRNITNVFS